MNYVPLRDLLRRKEYRLKIVLQRPAFWHTANEKETCSSLTKKMFKWIKTVSERGRYHFYTQFYLSVDCWNNNDSTRETTKYCYPK